MKRYSRRLREGMTIGQMYESESVGRKRQIDASDLSRAGQTLIRPVVDGLNKAKTNLETIIYSDQCYDEETAQELLEMHDQICAMLNRLPW